MISTNSQVALSRFKTNKYCGSNLILGFLWSWYRLQVPSPLIVEGIPPTPPLSDLMFFSLSTIWGSHNSHPEPVNGVLDFFKNPSAPSGSSCIILWQVCSLIRVPTDLLSTSVGIWSERLHALHQATGSLPGGDFKSTMYGP